MAKRDVNYRFNGKGEVVEEHVRTTPRHRSPASERYHQDRLDRRARDRADQKGKAA